MSFLPPINSSNILISLFGADVTFFHVLELSLHENGGKRRGIGSYYFARPVGDVFKLTSIASLPFETILAHVDGGRE